MSARGASPHLLTGTLAAVMLLGAGVPQAARAQATSGSAPAAPTREELRPESATPQEQAPSRLSVEGGFERGTCALSDPSLAGVRVTFSRVTFAGLPGVDPAAMEETWRALAGTEQPLSALCEVRDRAAAMLRERGFLAAVQVPAQRIEKNGEVRMDVLAARLVDVQVRGKAGNAEQRIAAHLRRLTGRPWFNIHEAERQLLLLRDLPGFDVRLTLRPAGAGQGEVIGDVSVRRRPVEILLGGQNLGSRATGREGLIAQVALNDVTGMADRTTFSVFNTVQVKEQTVVSLAHEFGIGADGLRFGGRLVYGRARSDIAGGRFSSRTWIGAVEASYPFVRQQATNVEGAAGLDVVDQSIDFGGTRLSRDRLRVGWARLSMALADGASLTQPGYSLAEPRFGLSGEIELRKGIAGLGASGRCQPVALCLAPNVAISNIAANPQGALVRAEAEVQLRPAPGIAFVLTPRAQYSASQLLSFEQFTLGNYTIGRGYDPGAAQGDSGLGLSAEVRIGRKMPRGPEQIALQPYAFVDAGWVWTDDNGLTPRRHLVSAGGGVRARWGDHADVNLAVAVPLERLPGATRLALARVLVTFSSRFVPWASQ